MKSLNLRPINDFDLFNPETDFWTDGNKVYHQKSVLRGANFKTLQYDGIFAKDDKKCFCGESWLKDADTKTFRILNYTYAIDKNNVHTITGKVKNADIESFEVLDDGKYLLWHNKVGIPEYTFYGYAKDKNHIYYHNYEGKLKIIKNADLKTFKSFNDGYFAKDKNHIYGNGKIIKKADPKSWKKLTEVNSLYSKDSKRFFYGFWELIQIDNESFEVIIPREVKHLKHQIAKDNNNYFENGEIITIERFNKLKERNIE
jgi:hypothetical protein